MKKRSVTIAGHRTSVTLEDEFWHALKHQAELEGLSMNAIITKIDEKALSPNLSSAIRLYILETLQARLSSI